MESGCRVLSARIAFSARRTAGCIMSTWSLSCAASREIPVPSLLLPLLLLHLS
ncbi:predicted protein [Plenodomus lingam JN3]|uniref:Predicted protein n=1 Tax=Leptosphaeria maculans (strain JN3 / isolate v23.1.3 / race Av1-4-5-6-7-8) TaxID=985895 RepID=E5A8B9_LEPMJ|nr:predicted protein [Plenodomus lingam JN3]CBX99864.1 predicted protein [Plenodomus lingam JN3]